MLRLFISVNCSDETRSLFLSVQDKIKTQSIKGNFSRPENLHLTLVFLGETPEDKAPEICSCLKAALDPLPAPFSLTFSQTGCFRHSHKELWWIGVSRQDPSLRILENIRRRIIDSLYKIDAAFDDRPFNPHITLGREIKHDVQITIPEQRIAFPVNRLSLMKSERRNGVLVYTEIFAIELRKC